MARQSAEIHRLRAELDDVRRRLFFADVLTVKMTLLQQGMNVESVPASELYDKVAQLKIPARYWPQWIQIELAGYQ